jgi:glycosyltransferase involved in cell wall biosynthesis
MSNTLLEAMAAGLPVVASRVGGNGEIVRDGVDGLLFPSGDVEALRAALVRLRGDPALRAAMGESARVRASTSFGIDAMIDRYEALYARAYAGGGSA